MVFCCCSPRLLLQSPTESQCHASANQRVQGYFSSIAYAILSHLMHYHHTHLILLSLYNSFRSCLSFS